MTIFQSVIDEIFEQLRADVGPIPGKRTFSDPSNLFQISLTSKLKIYLKNRGLQNALKGQMRDCYNTSACQTFLKKAVGLRDFLGVVYPKRQSTGEYLAERPDFYLGRLFEMFSEKIFASSYAFECNRNKTDNAIIDNLISNLIVEYFTKASNVSVADREPCINTIEKLLKTSYETFIDVVKHSQFGNAFQTNESRSDFEVKYVNKSSILPIQPKIVPPLFLTDQLGLLPFCNTSSKLSLSNLSAAEPTRCDIFEPFVTAKGLCYTFNSMSMAEIFRPSTTLDIWNSILNLKQNSVLENPSGYGPSNGLNFVVNSFETSSSDRSSKNVLLSITNENNPFDIFKQNYFIEPGNSYTYTVLANQIITNERFEAMKPQERSCSLPNENGLQSLTNKYSKSACEYQCAIKHAIQECKCLPWNIPQSSNENLPFCDLNSNNCFDLTLNTFSTQDCGCPSDCFGTSFSVFESVIKIKNPINFCDKGNKKSSEFPYTVYCSICKKILKTQKIRFIYENAINGWPIPDLTDDFCNKFLRENIALVKVEMATKSITRSLKDQRTNFVSQLSSLGKFNSVQI